MPFLGVEFAFGEFVVVFFDVAGVGFFEQVVAFFHFDG